MFPRKAKRVTPKKSWRQKSLKIIFLIIRNSSYIRFVPETEPAEVPIKKVQGIFRLKIREIETSDKVKLSALGKVIHCAKGETLWEGLAEDSYPKNAEENRSLINTYTQLYGKEIAEKVNPYFFLLQSLLDKLDNPILTEEEKDEKIEVEAR